MNRDETPDPIEWLRRHRPDPEPVDVPPDEDLLTAILAGRRVPSDVPPFSRRRRKAPWVIGGGLGVVVLATAAFVWRESREANNPTAVACMSEPDLDADRVGVAMSDLGPIEACREVWASGQMGDAIRTTDELTACTDDAGAALVFPAGAEVCADLGLAELDFTPSAEIELVARFERLIAQRVDLADCLDTDTARAAVNGVLEELGLDGDWIVVVDQAASADMPCITAGLNHEEQIVYLVPLPRLDP